MTFDIAKFSPEMPELEGSELQVKLAKQIRSQEISALKASMEKVAATGQRALKDGKEEIARRKFERAADFGKWIIALSKITSAKKFVEDINGMNFAHTSPNIDDILAKKVGLPLETVNSFANNGLQEAIAAINEELVRLDATSPNNCSGIVIPEDEVAMLPKGWVWLTDGTGHAYGPADEILSALQSVEYDPSKVVGYEINSNGEEVEVYQSGWELAWDALSAFSDDAPNLQSK